MEEWLKISLFLCIFGFMKEIRPSEPFVYEFLVGWKNVTEDELIKQVYPAANYSTLISLVIVFLITDMCRYKPLIIVLGLSSVITWTLAIWTYTLFDLIVVFTIYGFSRAAEIAYYSYIYAKVDRKYYQKVTSHTRAAILAGRSITGISGQVFVSTKLLDYQQLVYVTLGCTLGAAIWALFLPAVNKSLYFHSDDSKNLNLSKKVTSAFALMKTHFVKAYTNMHVIKWSLWYALSTCGYIQVELYLQPLYFAIQEDGTNIYNGAVEAMATLLGFMAALFAGYLKFTWEVEGELTLGIISLFQGILIVVISQTDYIFLCYSLYILFSILFHFMVTIASAEIAKNISQDSYGLVFGINMLISLAFNSILTTAVATEGSGFALGARGQYVVYGGYHLVISLIFVIMGLRTLIVLRKAKKSLNNEN